MEKVGLPTGLIRYSSQRTLEGEPRCTRPRVIMYSALLVLISTIFTIALLTKPPVDVNLLRGRGLPFTELDNGLVSNQIRVKVTNRLMEPGSYSISLMNAPEGARVELEGATNPFTVPAGEQATVPVIIMLPRAAFVPSGTYDIHIAVETASGYRTEQTYRLLGPMNNRATRPAGATPHG
jgi:polyferredoxin